MKFTFAVLFLVGTLWAAQETSSQVTAKPWENLLGSWKELPGPDTPALLKSEPEGHLIKFSLGCKQEDSCPDVIVAAYDGKQYKDTGNANWQVSYQKKGERTLQEEGYLNGRLSSTTTWQISSDGNTLTRTTRSINPPGSKDRTLIHERSGGPVSKDDLFIGFWKYNWDKSDPTILTYTAKGGLLTLTQTYGITGERNCDGKDHASENIGAGWTYSCQFADEHTYELTRKQNGKIDAVITRKISTDGRTMVATVKNAEGKVTSTTNLEKVN